MRLKIAALVKFILLLTLVFLMLTLLLNSVSKSSKQINDLEQNIQLTGSVSVLKNKDLSLSSACLSRDILDSHDVKLYGNRLSNHQYYLTIGIPTVARQVGYQYLMRTLSSLTVNQTVRNSKTDIFIVLQLGDQDEAKRTKLAAEISTKYAHLINDGVLDIIQVYPKFYPSFDKLKQRFGDSESRIKWRSKQVVDFSFLSCYCYGLGKYHLQLEDDVVASPYYYLKLKDFIESHEAKEKWFTLDASVLGYIGKVYHNRDLNQIASFYYIFFDEMPVDWMEYTWRDIKGQRGRWRFRAASLFQHIGKVSSLQKKKQVAQEPYFDNQVQKFLGFNPPAKVETDLIAEHDTDIKLAYQQGSGYFWGRCHDRSICHIKVILEKALPLQRVIVESGGNFAENDTIHHGSIKIGTHPNINDCEHYEVTPLATIKKGTFEIKFLKQKTVKCISIEIQRQNEWIFIREINVWPGKELT